MSPRPRTMLLALPALLVALALGACGDSHTPVKGGTYAGESGANAPYLDVGPLVYEVQQSRQLNPANSEDAAYLRGLGPAQQKLAPGEEWFGVFVQVFNNTDTPALSSNQMTISDTQGNTYQPITPAQASEYIYRPENVPAHGRLPQPDSTAGAGGTQGALLLFKIQTESLDNRPLEIHIVDPADSSQRASAELDV